MKWISRLAFLSIGVVLVILFSIGLHHNGVMAQVHLRYPLDTTVFDREIESESTFFIPAEFEPIDSIWMAYPVYENRKGYPSQSVQEAMIKALVPHTKIDLLVQDETEFSVVIQWLMTMELPANQVRLHIVPHTDIWMRDMGPIFLNNPSGEMKIADFGFNTWSYSNSTDELAMIDESVDRLVAREMELPILRSSLISEGGDREFNGKGTLMVTEAVEMQRNPGLTKAEIETELKRIFNVKKVIWLKQGLADDDLSFKGKLPGNIFTVLTTGGHIDEFARFVDPHTILLAEVSPQERDEDPIARITYDRMEENYRILQSETDQDGQPFQIIRVPVAAPIYATMDENDEVFNILKTLSFEDGTTIVEGSSINTILAASYLNFVVANDVVLIPAYAQPGRSDLFREKDAAVKTIFETVFPDREIIPINPEAVNAGGGGMHCIVQQMPLTVANLRQAPDSSTNRNS